MESNLSTNKNVIFKALCSDLGAKLSVRLLILALLTALPSAECTLSATRMVTLDRYLVLVYYEEVINSKLIRVSMFANSLCKKVSFLRCVRKIIALWSAIIDYNWSKTFRYGNLKTLGNGKMQIFSSSPTKLDCLNFTMKLFARCELLIQN